MGDYIKWFERRFYANSIGSGAALASTLILMTFTVIAIIEYYIDSVYLLGIIASTTIASKMLYDSVKEIIVYPENIKYLVSRDTKELSPSDINKAAIETYAENLSDGVIAPLFYLLIFGLYGAFIYKAINTLDSMIAYRNERYEKFGKFSAKLDDAVNYIPARGTAFLIAVLLKSKKALKNFYSHGRKHESPNAGHPISAMALALNIELGGPTSYFGKMKPKPFFGKGKQMIEKKEIKDALSLQLRLDIFLIILLGLGVAL